MANKLLDTLQMLERDYADQPIIVQRADLREINQLRTQLGMPLVDDKLNAIGAVAIEHKHARQPKQAPDHTQAREIYQAFLQKKAELEPHQAYADRVAKATGGPGMTPVRPLATMGTDGGPLLCDHCRKPIVLEGGDYHGKTADVAWKKNPDDRWMSWILGGLVVEIQTNGTLRIYHGYIGRGKKACCNVARREDDKAREKFVSRDRVEQFHRILPFLEHEFPDRTREEHFELLNEILDVVFSYDPGIGINRPNQNG